MTSLLSLVRKLSYLKKKKKIKKKLATPLLSVLLLSMLYKINKIKEL